MTGSYYKKAFRSDSVTVAANHIVTEEPGQYQQYVTEEPASSQDLQW